jgi:hypothetical protein
MMRLSNILMPDISLPASVAGSYLNSTSTVKNPMSFAFLYIYLINICFITILMMILKRFWNEMQLKTPVLLLISLQIKNSPILHLFIPIKSFLSILYGSRLHKDGNSDKGIIQWVQQLVECIQHHLLQVNASTCALFSQW